MADMLGHATSHELNDLYIELISMSAEERRAKQFALFVVGKGMLNGEQALEYLKSKLKG